MGDPAARAGVEHRVGLAQPSGDVVGVEDGHRGGPAQAFGPHHRDVRPRDGQDAGRAVGGGRHRAHDRAEAVVGAAVGARGGHHRVARQVGRQVGPHRHRADARAAATVGDAEGLVEVEVAHVGPEPAGPGHADEGVEVGAVEVHLAAGLVHRGADVADGGLEHAVGRGVGHHQGGHVGGVGGELGPQVVEVDVAVVVARHHHDLHADHRRAGGVGAVGRGGDEAHVAAVVAPAAVVGPDGEQTGELALRPGVGLQRHGVVAGDVGQPGLEVADQAAVALGVGHRRVGVHVGEPGVADGLHLRRRVELHRARAERDHRPVEGEVGVGETAQVAHHVGLAAVGVEHRVGAELAGARPARRAGRRRWWRRGRRPTAVTPKACHTASTVSGVEVSSRLRPTTPSTMSRRSRSRPRARASRAAESGTLTVRVSKKRPWATSTPPARSPAAHTAVSRCTRVAMRRRPSGPCQTA